jgi:hypothetical protein
MRLVSFEGPPAARPRRASASLGRGSTGGWRWVLSDMIWPHANDLRGGTASGGGAASVTANHLGNGGRSPAGHRFRVSLLYEQAVPPNMPDVAAASGARYPTCPSALILCGGEIVVVMAAMPA